MSIAEDPRAGLRDAFAARHGWTSPEPLSGDASARKYFRLQPSGAILMDADPAAGVGPGPFVGLTTWLRGQGYSAPAVLATDIDAGFLMLEDFGDDLFHVLVASDPTCEATLYSAAVDLLADLQTRPIPANVAFPGGIHDIPAYNGALLLREIARFQDWYLPAMGAEVVVPDALLFDLIAPVADGHEVVILRDYHAENLVWLPSRDGLARVGLLDYQDALRGHPAYDLVSLLHDARRDVAAPLAENLTRRFLDLTGHDAETFGDHAARLSVQRNLKILGLFVRLASQSGKTQYLTHLPRVWDYLQMCLRHPALASLRDWIGRHVPPPEGPRLLAFAKVGR